MQTIGHVLGEAFAIAVLFGFSKSMEVTRAFTYTAIFFLCMSLFSTCLIKEPTIKVKSEYVEDNESLLNLEERMSNREKVGYLTRRVIVLLRSDAKFALCLFGKVIT